MSVVWGKGMRRCIPFDFCCVFLCLLFGARECADAFRLISALSFYVCCLGGRECADAFCLISVLSFYVCCLGGRECADAFRLISVVSFLCLLFGGKGMRRCIPFDF